MRGMTIFHRLFLLGIGLSAIGCAGRTPKPEDPASVDQATTESETASADPQSGSHSLDVGMEFKDKGDDENRRANREAPPTATWKPVEKGKAADPKAADPKKESVTAAR